MSFLGEKSTGAWIEDLTWPEIEARLASGARAVLPIGAESKEHGRHLPLSADACQAKWLCARLAERAHVLIWPLLGYGYYPAFVDYPGSSTLSQETFERVVADILSCIAASGARSVLVVNTGISTIAPLESVVRSLSSDTAVALAHVYRGARYMEVERRIREQPRGGHADEMETSILLAIAPERVDMTKARRWTSESMGRGKFVRGDSQHRNYCPDGVFGDPTLATREKGEQLLAAMLEDLMALVSSSGKNISSRALSPTSGREERGEG
jgi:creatinine amidohydrolase